MPDLCDLTLYELSRMLARRDVSSTEVTRACLARAAATQYLGAFLHLDTAGAMSQAQMADARYQERATRGPLDGIPVGLKDIFLTAGLPTTCGSRLLAGFVAPYDATVVTRLKAAGAVLLGKLSMDEFAMGSSNEHCAFGPVRNPWDPARVPGGSSGGSAVAVATGAVFGSLGTDTGGSIRQPAAFTGVVGLKPTYGRVSRYGVTAFASSLDQVGPLAKDITDCALLLQIIAGPDRKDATSANQTVPDFLGELEQGVAGVRLGVPREFMIPGIDPEVRQAMAGVVETYRSLGAEVVDVSLPLTRYAVATYYLLATAEASSNLARFDGVRLGARRAGDQGLHEMYVATRGAGFGPEVKRRIILGTFVLSAGYYDAYYRRAQQVRTLIQGDFARAFDQVDLLLTPTTPTPAFELGEKLHDPITMYLADIFTVSCNLAGLPGLSFPAGRTETGLPIGAQLLGPAWSEASLLRVARAYEREHPGPRWRLA